MGKININEDFHPDILGMQWRPGDLVMVAGPVVTRSIYINGNIIARGTGAEIPVAVFSPGGEPGWIMWRIMKVQEAYIARDKSGTNSSNPQSLPLYIDDSQNMTISYLVGRIFHLVESSGVRMFIVHPLHFIDGSIFDDQSREVEMSGVLRLLKALAVSLEIMIVVSSRLSERCIREDRLPAANDILYATDVEKYCDQIILFHRIPNLSSMVEGRCRIVLSGRLYDGVSSGDLVINAVADKHGYCLERASVPFDEIEKISVDVPMNRWFTDDFGKSWQFGFLDSYFMGWNLLVELFCREDSVSNWRISVGSWDGKECVLAEESYYEDIDFIKSRAIELARRKFPDVVIEEKS